MATECDACVRGGGCLSPAGDAPELGCQECDRRIAYSWYDDDGERWFRTCVWCERRLRICAAAETGRLTLAHAVERAHLPRLAARADALTAWCGRLARRVLRARRRRAWARGAVGELPGMEARRG